MEGSEGLAGLPRKGRIGKIGRICKNFQDWKDWQNCFLELPLVCCWDFGEGWVAQLAGEWFQCLSRALKSQLESQPLFSHQPPAHSKSQKAQRKISAVLSQAASSRSRQCTLGLRMQLDFLCHIFKFLGCLPKGWMLSCRITKVSCASILGQDAGW